MPQVMNYTAIESAYKWTGLNTLNQAYSTITLPEGIVTSIQVNWGGYGGTASGRHCIWRGDGSLLAQSSLMTVPEGRAWRTASITPVYVGAGTYYVGVWADPAKNRIFYQATTGTLHLKTATGGVSTASGANSSQSGMLPCRVDYDYPSRMKVKASGSWVSGKTYVKVGGSWIRAQRIWVKVNGTWTKTKIT